MSFEEVRAWLGAALAGADADYCEIRLEDSEDLEILYQGTALERVRKKCLFGGAVRALYRGGWGFANFNNLDELEANVALACEQARAAGAVVNEESKLAAVPVVVEDVAPQWTMCRKALSLDEKIDIMGNYHKLVLSHEHIPAAGAMYLERFTILTFANSEGTCIRQQKLDLGGAVMAQGRKDGVSVAQYVGFGSSIGIDPVQGLEEKVKEMCERTQALLDAPSIPAGVYTTICDPALTGLFVHEAFGHLSEADDLCKDPGFLKAMTLGRVLGRPILNIYDTGDIMTSRGGLVYDDEGVKCVRADLVKEGVLVGRLNSRWSAAFLGEEVTGSARALTYIHPPIVRMRNTSIAAGESTFEDMLKDIKLGVYAVGSGGGETNGEMFNFAAGYGRMIRDGKLAEYVRDVKLQGNVFDTMENIDMIGNDEEGRNGPGGCGKGEQAPLPTSGLNPHVRIQNVIVGGVKG